MDVEKRVLDYLSSTDHTDDEKCQFDIDIEALGEQDLVVEFSDGEYFIMPWNDAMESE